MKFNILCFKLFIILTTRVDNCDENGKIISSQVRWEKFPIMGARPNNGEFIKALLRAEEIASILSEEVKEIKVNHKRFINDLNTDFKKSKYDWKSVDHLKEFVLPKGDLKNNEKEILETIASKEGDNGFVLYKRVATSPEEVRGKPTSEIPEGKGITPSNGDHITVVGCNADGVPITEQRGSMRYHTTWKGYVKRLIRNDEVAKIGIRTIQKEEKFFHWVVYNDGLFQQVGKTRKL